MARIKNVSRQKKDKESLLPEVPLLLLPLGGASVRNNKLRLPLLLLLLLPEARRTLLILP
jgi:hypothetical protein